MENGHVCITCFAILGFLNTFKSKSFLDVMSSLFLIEVLSVWVFLWLYISSIHAHTILNLYLEIWK